MANMHEERDHVVEEVRENFTLKTLQERVWRLESENKELKVNNSILQTQYTSQCETQSDILRTLHANLDENYSKMEESDMKIQRLEQQLEDQKQEFKDKLDEEQAQWERRVAELQMKNEHLEDKLNEVSEFQRNKDTMEAKLASLQKQLQDQAEAHTRDVSAFDRKKAIEIDQLKKDMQRGVREMRELLKARTKDQLDSTTKRTIMENEQMATELHFQSKETERILDRNKSLVDENSRLRRNLQIHKDLENELARRTHVYQKLIKRMGQKQKADDDAKDETLEFGRSEDRSIGGGVSRELPLGDSMMSGAGDDNEHERLKKEKEGIQNTLQMVRNEFAHYRHDHATLTQLQDQSTRLIISALYDLKQQRDSDPFPPSTYDEHANWQFVQMTPKQKEYFFRVLLEKLNSSMCSSCFPAGNQPLSAQQSTTSLPTIAKPSPNGSKDQSGHFSNFLWSVASHGGPEISDHGGKEIAHKGCQTETVASDPCLKDGLWSPQTRKRFNDSPTVTPAMVVGNVRTWGPRALSQKHKGSMPRMV